MTEEDSKMTGASRPHAPYGKACLLCVKSKTRCVAPSTGGKCERCLRLSKECQPAPTLRKARASRRRAAATNSAANKTAALEEKLDGIVRMLQSAQGGQSPAGSSIPMQGISQFQGQVPRETLAFYSPNGSIAVTSGATGLVGTSPLEVSRSRSNPHEPPTPATSCSSIAIDMEPCPKPVIRPASPSSHIYPPETEAECKEYLDTFRSKMTAWFPIIVIPPEVTVKDMRQQRPFLWLVIRAVCSKNAARQRGLGIEIRTILGKEMLLEGVKSFDLLQGILVFVSWGHYYVVYKPIITTSVQLAISLASDLGLTKPIPTEPLRVMLNYSSQGCPKPFSCYMNPIRSMEERRAMIGLFLISSVVANYFQRIEPMRWTPYLEECLRLIDEKKDYPTDALLVYLVRIQLICNKAASITAYNSCIFGDSGGRVPQDFYVCALKSQLDSLRDSIPVELKENAILQLSMFNASISIYEHSLVVPASKTSSLDPTSDVERIENLWACLTATKSWFTTFFSPDLFPLSTYPHLSMSMFNQLSHCTVALFRLSTFDSPGILWDRQRVSQEISYERTLKDWVERWERVPAAAGLDTDIMSETDEGPWCFTRKGLLILITWWETKIAPKLALSINQEGKQYLEENMSLDICSDQQQPPPMDFSWTGVDFTDDSWIRDILGGGYELFKEPYY